MCGLDIIPGFALISAQGKLRSFYLCFTEERSVLECPPRAHSSTRITADTMGLWGWVVGCPHTEVSWSQLDLEGSSHFLTPLNIPSQQVGQTAIHVVMTTHAVSGSPFPTLGLGAFAVHPDARERPGLGFQPSLPPQSQV